MADTQIEPQKKFRRAEMITPPNKLKEAVGSGGLDQRVVNKAQELLKNNKVDFQPQATLLLGELRTALLASKGGTITGEAAIEAIIYPAMQLKAQAGMFQYPLVSEISNILVNFLETVENVDKHVLEISDAHRQAISAIVSGGIKGDGGNVGKELREALMDACNRFYKTRKK